MFIKSVWSPVIGELPREGAYQPIHTINLQCVAVIKIFRYLAALRQKFIHWSCGIILHKGVLSFALSNICHISRRRRKGKDLEVLLVDVNIISIVDPQKTQC